MLRVPARPLPATVCRSLGQQRDLNADRCGQPRDHVAIAAVITMTAQHQPMAGVRIRRTTHGMRLRQREASAHRV